MTTDDEGASDAAWYVYVLESLARPVTYVGIAKDVEARLAQHNGERPGGARSTRAARPWRVAVVLGPFPDRGAAQAEEHRVKQLPRAERLGTVPVSGRPPGRTPRGSGRPSAS